MPTRRSPASRSTTTGPNNPARANNPYGPPPTGATRRRVNADQATAEASGPHARGNQSPGTDQSPRSNPPSSSPASSAPSSTRTLAEQTPIGGPGFQYAVQTPDGGYDNGRIVLATDPETGRKQHVIEYSDGSRTPFDIQSISTLGPADPQTGISPVGPPPNQVPAQIPATAVGDYGGGVFDSQSTSPFNNQTFLAASQRFQLASARAEATLGSSRAHLQRQQTLLGDYYGRAGTDAAEATSLGFEVAGWWGGNTRLQEQYDARSGALAGYGYALSQATSDYYSTVNQAVSAYESRLGELSEQGVAVGQQQAVDEATGQYQALLDEFLGDQYATL